MFLLEEKIRFRSVDISDVIIDITVYEKLHLCLFLLSSRQYQIETWSNVNAAYDAYF